MSLDQVFTQLGSELGIQHSPTVLILTMALVLARILPVVILSPFLGGEVVPPEIRLGVGILLGLVLFPGLMDRIGYIPVSALPYIALLLKELFIGVCLGFVVSLVFEAALVSGTLIDTMAGTTMAQVMVPQMQQQVSIFSSLNLQLAVVLFLTIDGHHLVIASFAESLSAIPLDQFPRFGSGTWAFFDLILHVFGDILTVGVALAAPAILAAFLSDLALGMVNRVAPQVQVFFISMQVKPMATVLLVLVSLHLIFDRLVVEYGRVLKRVGEAIRLMS